MQTNAQETLVLHDYLVLRYNEIIQPPMPTIYKYINYLYAFTCFGFMDHLQGFHLICNGLEDYLIVLNVMTGDVPFDQNMQNCSNN